MSKRTQEINGPVLVEPSQLFCAQGTKRCKHLTVNWCSKMHKDIPRPYSGCPDKCPLAFETLFPKKTANDGDREASASPYITKQPRRIETFLK